MPKVKKTAIAKDDFTRLAMHIQDSVTLEHLFEEIVKTSNATCISYHNMLNISDSYVDEGKSIFNYNFPQDLIDYFNEQRKKNSATEILHVFSYGNFLWLTDLLEIEEFKQKGTESKAWRLYDSVGDGLLIPLYGPKNRRGFVFIGFKNKNKFDKIFPWQVQNLAQMAHVKICLILINKQKSLHFTNREIEVLELITLGKTNPEIGIILNISANTVSSYVKQIYLKLGTKDRVTTALRAKTLALIS